MALGCYSLSSSIWWDWFCHLAWSSFRITNFLSRTAIAVASIYSSLLLIFSSIISYLYSKEFLQAWLGRKILRYSRGISVHDTITYKIIIPLNNKAGFLWWKMRCCEIAVYLFNVKHRSFDLFLSILCQQTHRPQTGFTFTSLSFHSAVHTAVCRCWC